MNSACLSHFTLLGALPMLSLLLFPLITAGEKEAGLHSVPVGKPKRA